MPRPPFAARALVPTCGKTEARMTSFTTSDGTKIAYSDQGTGMPLLCLAGLTRTMGDFDYMRAGLPPCRLIRMDYRGRGGSDWTGAASYTVPQEGRDALELLDHLGVAKAAVLGTSRGGLIGMMLAAVAKDRLLGLCLNDIGPQIDAGGMARIADYVGRAPSAKTQAEMAARLPDLMLGFANVPPSRWLQEARLHYREAAGGGLQITYDPALREALLAALALPEVDLWPLFDACAGLPSAVIRGANSDLLRRDTLAEMQRRRPDMLVAEVPDRAHIPFLDEPEAQALLHAFIGACQ
jgi:pimeloyl-ACP methyl ester carboxylesterase